MRKVLTYPNPKLFHVADNVQRDEHTLCVVDEMIDTMYMLKALGLAANQIGEDGAIFVVDVDGEPLVALNPTLLLQDGIEEAEEACLSLPGIGAKVQRHKEAILIYLDMEGVRRTITAKGQLAKVFQHEMDHLNGELYWNNVGSVRRDILKRKYRKIHKNE